MKHSEGSNMSITAAGAHLKAGEKSSNWLLMCSRLPGLLQPCLAIAAAFTMQQLQAQAGA
jgi:hypothetical protein